MRRLIFRPLVLMLTFLVGLFMTFLFTFAGDALTQLFDTPSDSIPALCRGDGAEDFTACPQATMREVEEYAVYSTLLYNLYAGGHSNRILIQDHTSVDGLEYKSPASLLEELRRQAPLVQQGTLDSFRAVNEQSYRLDNRYRLPGASRFVDERDVKSYFREGGGGWQAFYRDYPHDAGFITFSKVGFNRDMNQALVYLTSMCGETCGSGSLIFLVKEGGAWRIKVTAADWVS